MLALSCYNSQPIEYREAPDMSELLEKFREYADVSEVTEKSYATALKCFFTWMHDNGIVRPERADIKAYVKFLDEPHKRQQRADREPTEDIITLSAGTQARYLRAVKVFFKWTASENLYPNIADNIKGKQVKSDTRHRDAFEAEDALKLLQSIDRSSVIGKRDYAMILLSITAGLRIIEMERADIKDFEVISKEHVLFIQGKGRDEKDKYKKVIAPVWEAVQDYLTARGTASKNEPLFTAQCNNMKGKRLSEPSIAKIIKDRMKAAGYDSHRLSAHSLRHTSVTLYLESGATLQEAQQHARHCKPETTQIYAHNLERKKSDSEQRIYDMIFGKNQDEFEELAQIYKGLSSSQKVTLLNIARSLKG